VYAFAARGVSNNRKFYSLVSIPTSVAGAFDLLDVNDLDKGVEIASLGN